MATFSAEIYKLGINPVVDPPDDVLDAIFEKAGRSKGPIPVCGLINGAQYVQTLVKYRGKWRLYINGEMLKHSGLTVGGCAAIEIEYDPSPRVYEVPPALTKALAANKLARSAFKKLTPSRRTEIVRYFGSLKTDAALDRNIDKLFRQLGVQ